MTFDEFRRQIADSRPRHLRGVENLVLLDRVESTNRLARRIADEYLRESMKPPSVLLVAREQTGGRGRRGKSWSSPPGRGIYATLMLKVAGVEALQTLPLLVGEGLAGALDRHLGAARCGIKWPNDLMVAGRKIGGILIEAVSRGKTICALVGFGINRSQSLPELPPGAATSLALETGEPPPLGRLVWSLVAAVTGELEHLGETAYAVERYRERTVHRPGDVLVCRIGDEIVEGVFGGFDEHGLLLLETGGGDRRISAGEVIEP